jgi:hypothetical protein
MACIALVGGWAATSQAAAPDLCARLTPAALSATLGEQFGAPVQTSAPAGEFKGDYVSCLYTSNALTFEIRRWAYPNAVLRERNLHATTARYAADARARKISDLGDSAWAFNEFIDVIQGPYEYYFAAYPTEPPTYHVDQTDKLTTIAKLVLTPP